jgi:hypothetical protein
MMGNPRLSDHRKRRYDVKSFAGGFLLAAAMLGGCAATAATPTPGETPFEISQSTNNALQLYLTEIGLHNGGAFAVSVDGNSSFMNYCPERVCISNLFGGVASSRCESISGQECFLLFVGREPRRAFSVAADKGVTGQHGKREELPHDLAPVFN